MKNQIFSFEQNTYLRNYGYYLFMAAMFVFGWFAGSNFNFSVGEGIHLNSPYNIGFISGMMSLSLIFISTVFGLQVLFKEADSRFDILLYTTPVTKTTFFFGKVLAVILLSFMSFLIFTLGFIPGSAGRTGSNVSGVFLPWHYLYPLLVFGLLNCIFMSSVVCVVAWSTRNKLLVSVTGLLLYMVYMITLLFSNSPLMAQSLPQSLQAQQISALLDPFGLSAYFFTSSHYTVAQRNEAVVSLEGIFALNRLIFLLLSLFLFYMGYRKFSFNEKKLRRNRFKTTEPQTLGAENLQDYIPVAMQQNIKTRIAATWSFVKIDLLYIFKSIPLVVSSMLLLFNTGMEMYAEIEKGIRLPQKFASSGLMASTIIENFHLIGLLLVCYYLNDIFWRSKGNRFHQMEETTTNSFTKQSAHFLSICLLILFFSCLLIAEGLIFQLGYGYPYFEPAAFMGVIVFNSLPLMLSAALILLINRLNKNRYVALAISILFILLTATTIINELTSSPLVKFQLGAKAIYSGFSGFSDYLSAYSKLLLFGSCIVVLLSVLQNILSRKKYRFYKIIVAMIISGLAFFTAQQYMHGRRETSKSKEASRKVAYEQHYRKFQLLPQPTITKVVSEVSLYPADSRYEIKGAYTLKNLSAGPIAKILLNVADEFVITRLTLSIGNEEINTQQAVSELTLKHAMQPGDSAELKYHISYRWYPVNKHESFNTIMKNGSFMRISRYFPQIGYQSQNETEDEEMRKKHGLGKATKLLSLDDPKTVANDFIELDMTVSTDEDQAVVGTGEMIAHFKKNNRNYFRFKPSVTIPFRFAISSARYVVKSERYKGKLISVYHHPSHYENVQQLIQNAKLTLDYCENNFGTYPFKSISFAEISGFTRGFAATAYPAAIFMTEDMVFHANIKADAQQDVINELAGHELAHIWWGNSQVDPDGREGAIMLTETLSMYTEMMLYKKMYGLEKMKERLKVHEQIYNSEKGFSEEQPLYKVKPEQRHIGYSKGAIVMCKLSELMGEDKLNKALKNFLEQSQNNEHHPTTVDFLNCIYPEANKKLHPKIDTMFKTTFPMEAL